MKSIKKIIALTSLLGGTLMGSDCCTPTQCCTPEATTPYIAIRSQGRDKTIQMVGMADHTFDYLYYDCGRGTFAITPEYTRTFRPQRLTQCLFGSRQLVNQSCCPTVSSNSCGVVCNDNCNDDRRCILIQGSQVANRNPNAWLADYFYLPTNFQSTICFEPRIQNFLLNLDLFVSLNDCICGTYVRFYTPFVWSRWDLNFCENVCVEGTNSHAIGYFNATGVERADLLPAFSNFASGQTPVIDGVRANGLRFGRFDGCDQTNTAFADFRMELGWDFWHTDCHYLGVNVQMAAPTGTRARACRLFEPVIGNGHHWELGMGVFGHRHLFSACDESVSAGFYFDANVTHMFSTRQRRTFDLCNRPNSRYMLAEKLAKPVETDLAGAPVENSSLLSIPADFQFKNEYTPVANLTTLDIHVGAAVQADIVAMFNVTTQCLSWDIGYNVWVRSCEHISRPDPVRNSDPCDPANICDSRSNKMWALKGDAHVYGFSSATVTDDIEINQPVALSATQSRANITSGRNAQVTTNTPTNRNFGVDNPLFAVAGSSGTTLVTEPGSAQQIKTSIQPIFITCDDVNLQSQRGLSQKVFTHFQYNWSDCECYLPFIGIGGYAEFGKNEKAGCAPTTTASTTSGINTNSANNCCTDWCKPCNDCVSCSLSQWAIWLKGGVSF